MFVGATTENPSFEINKALLSRTAVYALRPLDDSALAQILDRAAGMLGMSVADDGGSALLAFADGDARRLLGAMENAAAARTADGDDSPLTAEDVAKIVGQKRPRFDKGGDDFLRPDFGAA